MGRLFQNVVACDVITYCLVVWILQANHGAIMLSRFGMILSSEARGYGKIVLLYVRKSWDEYREVFKQVG